MRKCALLLTLLLLCLGSCSTVKEGVVVSKHYNPPKSVYASGVACQRKAEYYIKIAGENKRDKIQRRRVYLSKSTYENLQAGDFYIIRDSRDYK